MSAEQAFLAFTEQIAQWRQLNSIFQSTPGRAGTMLSEPGPDGRLLERYDDGDPGPCTPARRLPDIM